MTSAIFFSKVARPFIGTYIHTQVSRLHLETSHDPMMVIQFILISSSCFKRILKVMFHGIASTTTEVFKLLRSSHKVTSNYLDS